MALFWYKFSQKGSDNMGEQATKKIRGTPRAFADGDAFWNTFSEYVNYCKINERVPNVAGFVVYADINRDTYYAQKCIYPDTFKKINELLEDEAINTPYLKDAFKIFYMKNKFEWKDKQEIEAKTDNELNINIKVVE